MRALCLFIYIIFAPSLSLAMDSEQINYTNGMEKLNSSLDITSTLTSLSCIKLEQLESHCESVDKQAYPIAYFHLKNAIAFHNRDDFMLSYPDAGTLHNPKNIQRITEEPLVDCLDLAYIFNIQSVATYLEQSSLHFNFSGNQGEVWYLAYDYGQKKIYIQPILSIHADHKIGVCYKTLDQNRFQQNLKHISWLHWLFRSYGFVPWYANSLTNIMIRLEANAKRNPQSSPEHQR